MLRRPAETWLNMLLVLVCVFTPANLFAQEPIYSYRVVNRYPHDSKAFTQGLVFHEGYLYEGTGLYGESSLRQVRLEDGVVLRQVNLAHRFFGEGVTILNDSVLQLTWKEGLAFVYDLSNFQEIGQFSYQGEGWGITTDGEHLIMSDGSHTLTYLDAASYEPLKTVAVHGKEGPIYLLNELEYVQGEIFANVWFDHRICRIDPLTGQVLGWIDLSDLYAEEKAVNEAADVLNGIAYDQKDDRLFVTGKFWSYMYEICLEN